jgi:GTPase SAR1 family protein
LRPYWRHYYTGTQGVAFVVDASDSARLELAAAELKTLAMDDQLMVCRHWRTSLRVYTGISHHITTSYLQGVAIVVMLNKSDVPGALSVEEATRRLNLPTYVDTSIDTRILMV